jgi:adenylosuccinate synthase
MAVVVVVGAQYGGEGKGKIVAHLALRDKPEFVVRCGGPNSGHTVVIGNETYKLRLLPAGFVNPNSRLLLPAGSLINLNILFQEIEVAGVDKTRVGIDSNSIILTDKESKLEAEQGLRNSIGSTGSGTGAGVIKRIARDGSIKLAKDVAEAKPFLTDVSKEINDGIDRDESCIVEGTQGFGLSLYHTRCYPFATSRDTTASAFLSEVGISPLKVTSIIMAIRTFPIRVEGNSGPLENEINWHELRVLSGYPHEIHEFTTVTNLLRRVGKFDMDLVKRAAIINRPTEIALHGVDYIEYANKGKQEFSGLTKETQNLILDIEKQLAVSVTLIGTGPEQHELIDKTHILSSWLSFAN